MEKEDWRILGIKLVQKLKSIKTKTVTFEVPKKYDEFIKGLQLGDYTFDKYKSKKEKSFLKIIYLQSKSNLKLTVRKSINKAKSACIIKD